MANCAYRIFKDGTNYGIAINVTDAVASTWNNFKNATLYLPQKGGQWKDGFINPVIQIGDVNANTSSYYPVITFGATYGNWSIGTYNNGIRFIFNHKDNSTNGTHIQYVLPSAADDSTAKDTYEILTTKAAVTIAQGGTGAATAANARTNLGITPTNIGAKPTQSAVSGGTNNGIRFLATYSQDVNGVVTMTDALVRDASTTQSGLVGTGAQTFAGEKTFNNIITSTYAGNGFQLKHGTASKDCFFYAERTDTGAKVGIGVGSGGTNYGVYSFTVGTWMVYADASTIFANIQTFNKEATFAANVTVTGNIDIQTTWGYLRWKKSIGNNDISGLIAANNATTTDPARFSFYQYILDSSGNHITDNVYERFLLPAVTTTRTASKDFSILTSKSAVTIAQGGTGKTTATEAWTALGGGASGKHADSYFALASHNHAAGDITSGTLELARGGTGATTAALARTSLGLGTAATHAHGDYVTLADAQTISGAKTFSGAPVFAATPKIQNSSSPGLTFYANASGSQYFGQMFFNYATTSTYRRPHSFYFRQYSYNSTTGVATTSYPEDYHLPVVNANRTAIATYEIWTTKNYYATSSTALTYVTNSHCDATNLGYVRCDRSGRMAVLSTTTALYLKAYSSSAWIQIGTIPAGYRPIADTTVRIPLSSGNYMLRVTTDGAVQIYKSTNETSNAYFSIPWRIA